MFFVEILLSFCLIVASVGPSLQVFQQPSGDLIDLSTNTNIQSEDSCTDSTCILNCLSQTTLPDVFRRPLQNLQASADCVNTRITDTDLPDNIDLSHGELRATTGSNCVTFTIPELDTKFLVSFWVKLDCSVSCEVLNITDVATNSVFVSLELVFNRLELNGTGIIQLPDSWFFLSLQLTTTLSVFVDGVKQNTDGFSFPSFSSVVMEMGTSNEDNSIQFADLQIYKAELTDSKSGYLFESILPGNVRIMPECRCPLEHPKYDLQAAYNNECTNGSDNVSRFAPGGHILQYMNDGDKQTSWISRNVNTAVVDVALGTVFQINTVQIKFGASNTPTTVVIDLLKMSTSSSKQILSSDCSGVQDSDCKQIQVSENTVTWTRSMETLTRPKYETLLADHIKLTFTGPSLSYFEVAEVTVLGRCSCYGNAEVCNVAGEGDAKTYSCVCKAETKTSEKHCQVCQSNQYRDPDEFACSNECDCESSGVNNPSESCDQNGGKCDCKINVEGTRCESCKHLTYNLQTDNINGCTVCDCNTNGTSECDTVDGGCECKPHVSLKDYKCQHCNDYYYGHHLGEGCKSCNCSQDGTEINENCDSNLGQCQCNSFTGQCDCKSLVTGIRCDSCKDGYFRLKKTFPNGCSDCECSVIGSITPACDKALGQCPCHDNITTDSKCTPEINSVKPGFGPEAGGTIITINGKQIGGNGINVAVYMFGAKEKLKEISSDVTAIVVETLPFENRSKSREVPLTVVLSKNSTDISYDDLKFSYKDDPVVDDSPAFVSFRRGGCILMIKGKNLNSVYEPEILLSIGSNEFKQSCIHFGMDKMSCPTPSLAELNTSLSSYPYRLIFDGYQKYRNLTAMFPEAVITYVDDAEVSKMDDLAFRYPFIKTIVIKGKGFKTACNSNDFQVLIGGKSCSLDSISDTEIVCRPDVKFPGSGEIEKLELIIGSRTVDLGKVEFVIFWQSNEFIYICAGVAALFLIICIICIACCCCRRGRCKKKTKSSGSLNIDTELPILPLPLPLPQPLPQPQPQPQPKAVVKPSVHPAEVKSAFVEQFLNKIGPEIQKEVKTSIIDRSQIEPGHTCTLKGANIRRIDGVFKVGASFMAGQKLNIKSLKNSYPIEESSGMYPKWMTSGLEHFIKMRDFDHENVMKFYGIAVDDKSFYLLYPDMANRSLKEILLDSKKELNMGDLVDACLQTANGMRYLANEGFIHKDVAARNCMVDSNLNIRVSDNSFSWDLFPEEYLYDMERNRWRPVRWMAYESLKMGFYDTKSDVWSFGILMWEVMTRGCLPFQEVGRNEDISDYVIKGYRLGKPEDLCDMCFDVMLTCWNEDSSKRPEFSGLIDTMTNLINTMMAESETDANIYQNPEPLQELMNNNASPERPILPPRSPQNVYGNINFTSYDNPGFNM